MLELLREETRKAGKDYYCNACEVFFEDGCYPVEHYTEGYDSSEKTVIEEAYKRFFSGGKTIKKGDFYNYRTYVEDGEFHVHRALPEIDKICNKYNYYDE